MSRPYTNKLLELIDEGMLNNKMILEEMLCYFSEDEIKDFCINSFASEIEHLFKVINNG